MLSSTNGGGSSQALIEYLPNCGNGAILFTTRDNVAATRFAEANVIHVQEMSRQESLELLTVTVQIQKHKLLEDEASKAELLGLFLDLPRAVKQAAAYMNEKSTHISKYLAL